MSKSFKQLYAFVLADTEQKSGKNFIDKVRLGVTGE